MPIRLRNVENEPDHDRRPRRRHRFGCRRTASCVRSSAIPPAKENMLVVRCGRCCRYRTLFIRINSHQYLIYSKIWNPYF